MTETETYCTAGLTIFGDSIGNPNVDMAGLNSSALMNSYGTTVIHGNGCAP
jgi:hypothetical protein